MKWKGGWVGWALRHTHTHAMREPYICEKKEYGYMWSECILFLLFLCPYSLSCVRVCVRGGRGGIHSHLFGAVTPCSIMLFCGKDDGWNMGGNAHVPPIALGMERNQPLAATYKILVRFSENALPVAEVLCVPAYGEWHQSLQH